MKIDAIKLTNIRSYRQLDWLQLSPMINVFIGKNNAGKSTILKAILKLQSNEILQAESLSLGTKEGRIEIKVSGNVSKYIQLQGKAEHLRITVPANSRQASGSGVKAPFEVIPAQEPENLIFPYLSYRKTTTYSNEISEKSTKSVEHDLKYLYAKIDRYTPQMKPAYEEFVAACRSILGFEVGTITKHVGKIAAYFVHNQEHIPISEMGDGVASILGLLVDLALAEEKVFLIEEPENDLHPEALKSLLNLFIKKSDTNQFFITTHSHIVMQQLGAIQGMRLFQVTSQLNVLPEKPNLFLSQVRDITEDREAKKAVLENMGYSLADFDLWSGYLILEESSAEWLIREYLIPWFVPELRGRLRTYSAGGSGKVARRFEDLNSLFTFLHLEPIYRNKVWVMIDAGTDEDEIIKRLRHTYVSSGWGQDQFSQFTKHDFEEYLPTESSELISGIQSISDAQEKRQAKARLRKQVEAWIAADQARAKEAFTESAAEVIDFLKRVKSEVLDKAISQRG